MVKKILHRMSGNKGALAPRKPWSKIAWSWLGAFLGIYCVSWLMQVIYLDQFDAILIISSFGATAVLLYGAPQADFSQPRSLIGGHLVSAWIGVTLYQLLMGSDVALLAALSVSISIVAMHFTRTMHPPGGATAMIAAIGGDAIHQLGYWYLLAPVGVGVLVMLLVALLSNNLSANPKRHYPIYWW